ncbi:MAG: polyprenyl synthetase family protein [Pacificimonas sp.]
MSATIHQLPKAESPPSIEPMMRLVAPEMNGVNEIILARMQSDVAVIPTLAGHLISGGGKRLRPMLTLASARLLGYEGARHHKLAAAVEFIHTATLLHDDVVDGSGQRRGKRAANLIWGNEATVLVGDFLFSRSFELMVEDGSLRVLKILSAASAIIAEGEVDQLQTQRRIDTTEDRYLGVITAKTAVLFAAACQIAGVVAESSESAIASLESYGRNLGIAFQLVDDAIDYGGDADTMGKDAGDDFREGKLTLPVILAYKRGDEAARAFWKQAIETGKTSEADFAEARQRMADIGAIDDTLERARHYGRLALDAIADFPGGAAKDALSDTVRFAVARGY